ncbi:MAG TPA: zf-TFIIB domain-containing protein [Phycisphaerae bacterium]|nr:zf-TFIIB domain-containing protein [Phycisphaerae bacterium]HRW54412.1 zf-TFIIB domain-containing protein [Phycisphaerae bacterium]
MNCPKCPSNALESRTVDGITIDECPTCHGIWLDALELEGLLAADATALLASDSRFHAQIGEEGARLNCPKCHGTYLIKLNSRIRPGTILDSCTVCFGTWLDAGEFARLAEQGLWASIKILFLRRRATVNP